MGQVGTWPSWPPMASRDPRTDGVNCHTRTNGQSGGGGDPRTNTTPGLSQGQIGTLRTKGLCRGGLGTQPGTNGNSQGVWGHGSWVLPVPTSRIGNPPPMLAAHQSWAGGLLGACGHQPAVTGVVPFAQSSLCPHCISQWVPFSLVPVCWHRQVHAHPGSSLSQSGTPELQGTT